MPFLIENRVPHSLDCALLVLGTQVSDTIQVGRIGDPPKKRAHPADAACSTCA